MKPHVFTGPDMTSVIRVATAELGDDVTIVSTRMINRGNGRWAEITAVRGEDVERFRDRIDAGPLPVPPAARDGSVLRPLVVALVGPNGAGKTTTAAKIALSPHAFGSRKVGLLTLDTYRVGAIDQIRTYADVAGMPLEVVYQARDIPDALNRLGRCEVIVVDTPGRGPRAVNDEMEWREVLAAIAPDETHLVVPATARFDFVDFVREAYEPAGVTHALITKLDELPTEASVVELADRLGLQSRWVTDGQEVPVDLRGAVQRILHALSQTSVNRRTPSRAVA